MGRVPQCGSMHRNAYAAIGHTRWATHGEVSERIAHPHLNADARLAVVHNGIIENADALRRRIAGGAPSVSDTDSEVMAHLVRQEVSLAISLPRAVHNAFLCIEGINAFVVLDLRTREAAAITHRLPLRISRADGYLMLASDPVVFAGLAESVLVLPDDLPVSLGQPEVIAGSLHELERTGERMTVPASHAPPQAGPGSSMRAEIAEQPMVLERLAASREVVDETIASVARARRIVLTGCGSAFHGASYAAERIAYGSFLQHRCVGDSRVRDGRSGTHH